MPKDNKIAQITPPKPHGEGECPRMTIDIPDNYCPLLPQTTPQTTPPDLNRLSNAFGVDKLDLIFQKGEFDYCQTRPQKWTEKTITSETSKSTKYFYQNGEIGYIAEIVPDSTLKDGYLHISANPSKPHHEYELTNNPTQIFDFYRSVCADLRKYSVEVDMERAKISRLDLAHNILLDHDLLTYNNVFDTLQGKRQFKRAFGETRYWKNGENEFIIYDKKREIIEHHKKRINMPNVTRAEVKALKGRSVAKIFGVRFLGDILERNFKEEYNLYVTERILRTKFGQQLRFDFEEMQESFLNCIEKFGKRHAIGHFYTLVGIIQLSESKNGLIYLQELIKENYNERTVRRQMSKINNFLSIAKPLQQKKEQNFIVLNDEIRSKILVA